MLGLLLFLLAPVPARAGLPSDDLCRAANSSSGCIDFGRRDWGRHERTRPDPPERRRSPEEIAADYEELRRNLANMPHPKEERPLSADVPALLFDDLHASIRLLEALDDRIAARLSLSMLDGAVEIGLHLTVFDGAYPLGVIRLPAAAPIPAWLRLPRRPEARDDGRAEEKSCEELDREMKDACRAPPEPCAKGEDCVKLREKRKAQLRCAYAAKALEERECGGAGEPGRKDKANEAAVRCGELVSKDCCPEETKKRKRAACPKTLPGCKKMALQDEPAKQDCVEAGLRLNGALACLQARLAERDECFDGIDDLGHADQVSNLNAQIGYCRTVLDRCRELGL